MANANVLGVKKRPQGIYDALMQFKDAGLVAAPLLPPSVLLPRPSMSAAAFSRAA